MDASHHGVHALAIPEATMATHLLRFHQLSRWHSDDLSVTLLWYAELEMKGSRGFNHPNHLTCSSHVRSGIVSTALAHHFGQKPDSKLLWTYVAHLTNVRVDRNAFWESMDRNGTHWQDQGPNMNFQQTSNILMYSKILTPYRSTAIFVAVFITTSLNRFCFMCYYIYLFSKSSTLFRQILIFLQAVQDDWRYKMRCTSDPGSERISYYY